MNIEDQNLEFTINFSKNEKQSEYARLESALYIVATPIGNLKDITIRALETLASVDQILCEDSRVSSKLLQHYKIKTQKLLVYNDHSDSQVREKICHMIASGMSVALISDAGTPLISDPGYKLIEFLRARNQKIIPIPGASSLITSLCTSGISCEKFIFLGFLPHSIIQKEKLLSSLPCDLSFICFESPQRIVKTIEIIHQQLGNRRLCLAKELTKIYEEFIVRDCASMIEFLEQNQDKIRGEMVLIVEKIDKKDSGQQEDIAKVIVKALEAGQSLKNLSSDLSEIYQINKKEVYQLALKLAKNDKT